MFMLLSAFLVMACSKEEGTSTITVSDKTQLNQSLYADETSGKKGDFTFTATENWTTSVSDVTPGVKSKAGSTWITLNPASGGAGTVDMKITLAPNDTGADRKAEIKIICGGTTITVTVEQKGIKQDGTKPDVKPTPDTDRLISRIDIEHYDEDGNIDVSGRENYITFTYDDKKRLVEKMEKDSEEAMSGNGMQAMVFTEITQITYGNASVSFSIRETENQNVYSTEATARLNESGYMISEHYTDSEEKSGMNYSWSYDLTLTYDKDNYVKTNHSVASDGDNDYYFHTWKDGNLSQLKWLNNLCTDKAEYGTVKNITNLDLNWILYNTEGWDFSVGDPYCIFPLMGLTGKRSQNMVEKVSAEYFWGESDTTADKELREYKYVLDNQGYPSRIECYSYNYSNNKMEKTKTYVITYNK